MSTYGYSDYTTGYTWQGQSYPTASSNLYGLTYYSGFNVTPFTATPRDYTTIMLQWVQPQGAVLRFRLLANRYGFPVDQNDGNVIIDSATLPGTAYADQQVVPGTYHYYGIYLQVSGPNTWLRAGLAVCLAPANHATGSQMLGLLPNYFREQTDTDLTTDAAGNQYLAQYLNVIGWGLDYLKTQYDIEYGHLNDPMTIPLNDLTNLAAQIGMPFQPELPASLIRKSVANWTHVCQERGTPGGISEQVTLLTGYPVDIQAGVNLMLEDDQAEPRHPRPANWTPYLSYVVSELVTFGNYIYKCILAGGEGTSPTGTTGANTYWQVVQNVTDAAGTLRNTSTVGGISTWEAIYPALDSGGSYTPPAGALVTTVGVINPLATSAWTHNAFSVFNKAGTAQDIMLRSVSRIASDMTGSNTLIAPDRHQAAADGLPVPRLNTNLSSWEPGVRYATGSVIIYDGVLMRALRASTGATPPSPYTPVNQNSTFATSISPWTAQNGASVALSSAEGFQGTTSLLVTPNGTTANPGALSEGVPVIPSATYTVSGWVYVAPGYATTQLGITWYDSFGQFISTSASTVTSVAAATWTNLSLTVAAPANATTGVITPQLNGTPASSVLSYWDVMILSCAQTPEWCVLSPDNRLRLMVSGQVAQSLTTGANQTVPVVPFVEWYDEQGNIITSNGQARVFARTASAGVAGGPPSLSYDSFALGIGTYLGGRMMDTQDQVWVSQTGSFLISGFNSGSTYPATAGVRSIATVTGLPGTAGAPVWLGVTFGSPAGSGQDLGIVFRFVSTSSYWRAGMTGLYSVTGGAATLVGAYSTACAPGDRLTVNLSGNNITVYRNGSQVLTTTNAYNATATLHGLAAEGTTV